VNEVWHARSGIVARGCARGRVRSRRRESDRRCVGASGSAVGPAQQAQTLARDRLPAVAVDGKTSRGARRADGTRVHLLGAAEYGGHLLDHREVDASHNKTSHLTEFVERMDLEGAVVTFDALRTVWGEPELAGRRQESPLHRRREERTNRCCGLPPIGNRASHTLERLGPRRS
jgi:hypothetical protein